MLEWEPARWLFAAETECSAGCRLHYDCTMLYFLCKCLSERFLFVSKAFVTVCVRACVWVESGNGISSLSARGPPEL